MERNTLYRDANGRPTMLAVRLHEEFTLMFTSHVKTKVCVIVIYKA